MRIRNPVIYIKAYFRFLQFVHLHSPRGWRYRKSINYTEQGEITVPISGGGVVRISEKEAIL